MYDAILIGCLNKVRTKLKGTWLIIFPDYAMLLSLLFLDYTMLLSLREKLKIKSQSYRNKKDKNQVLPKEQVENADLYKPVLNKILTARD